MRNWRTEGLENFGIFQPYSVEGRYEIPTIAGISALPDVSWIGYNYARADRQSPAQTGVHFFMDDYQFAAVWNRPSAVLEKLKKYGAALSPDFSTYADMPKALQLWSHYKKHWCAQYWQSNGVTVVPTISWSTAESLKWCFDGEPRRSVVAISTVGVERDKEAFVMFAAGYQEMLFRLEPTEILCYGKRFDFMKENVTVIEPFVKQLRKRCDYGRQRG